MKILLHSCCGPCSTHPLEFLTQYFKNIVLVYNNSNIYPSEEYSRRLEELERYIEIFNRENNGKIELIKFDYDNLSYNQFLGRYGAVKEGGIRCIECYKKRMDEAYKYANDRGLDYFTTVMTISRQKNSQILNEIGLELSKKYTTKYFVSDFKKKNGYKRSLELSKEYGLYRQDYCGCIYSKQEREIMI